MESKGIVMLLVLVLVLLLATLVQGLQSECEDAGGYCTEAINCNLTNIHLEIYCSSYKVCCVP